jgi:lipopolysaccharide biosynthesis protein
MERIDPPTDLEDPVEPVRRVLFYLFHDRDGIVDDYVPYKLRALRPFVDHIFVVSNSDLTAEGRSTLEGVADTQLVRENVGWDVGAFTAAMSQFGEGRLAEHDELILMNSTFFAPVYPFAEVFERMAAEPVDFWGISSHPEVDPNPFTNTTGILERHLQTHWVTVRRRMFTSLEWRDFWATMPPLVTYDDVVLGYEARFTAYFANAGFSWLAAWPEENYPTGHAIFESAPLLLADRCPIVKRRQFFHEPMFLERNAIIGRRVLQQLQRTDYPLDLMWRNVARVAEPRVLYTNFSLLEMLPTTDGPPADPAPLETAEADARSRSPRVLAVAHVSDTEAMAPVFAALRSLPTPVDVVVTTASRDVDVVTRALHASGSAPEALAGPVPEGMSIDVRAVPDDRGGHMAALLVEGRDLLEPGRYDVLCHVHTVRPSADESNAAHLLEDYNLGNVLGTQGYVRRVLDLFEQHPTLGAVFPPAVHIGLPTLGHGWGEHRAAAQQVAHDTGIRTLFDPDTPLAPYGGMFWVRPEALAALLSKRWQHADYTDDHLGPAQELLVGYSALTAGWHVRCAMTLDWASVSYPFLEYKLQKVSAALPAHTQQQLEYIRALEAEDRILPVIKREVNRRYPRLGSSAGPIYRVARQALGRRGGAGH